MRGRNALTTVFLTLAVALALVPPAAATSRAGGIWTYAWHEPPSLVPGTATYDGGEWSFTDYPYDDHGANGSFIYPSQARYSDNAADLVALQIAARSGYVHYLARLDTLIVPDSTVLALAVDTDHNERTGGGRWPLGADVTTPGWEFAVTVWGTGGTVTTSRGRTTPIPVVADVKTNTIEFAVPGSIADPGSRTWRYRGGVGVWDAAARTWAEVIASSPGGPTDVPTGGDGSATQPDVFNLLFRNRRHDGGTKATDENESPDFQYMQQSIALSSGDLKPFYRDVNFGRLRAGITAIPHEPRGDAHFTRVYANEGPPNALVEGVSAHDTTLLYNGKYQPYIMFVPASYRRHPRPAPMFPLLHGWRGNHRGFNPTNNDFWNSVVRRHRALVAKPLGLGGEVWYEHVGELDVLQVMGDVARHYNVDPDRVYLGGTSMGGLGTVKIAEAHPDLFAGIFPSVPPMSDRAMGYAVPAVNEWDLVDVAASLRNVPVRDFTGTYDPLVPAGNDSRRFCDRLHELVYDHDCWRDISTGATHRGYENDRAAQIAQLLDEHTVVRNPARVTYVYHPYWRQQAIDAGVGSSLTYDSVYWVSGISYRAPPTTLPNDLERRTEGTGYGTLDVRTYGLGRTDPIATPIPDDPSPTLIRDGIVLTPGPRAQRRNAFDATFANLSGVTLDLGRMGLTLRRPLSAFLQGDGPMTLTLLGNAKSCAARLGNVPMKTRTFNGHVMINVSLNTSLSPLAVSCR